MLRFSLAAALVLFPAVVMAQQAQPSAGTPHEQALTQRLINEINSNLACNTNVIALQDEIKKLQAELKAKEAPADKKQDQLPKK